jgi:hypothetical protein
MTREEMLILLKSSICQVVFTKVNGETRDMRCTLVRDMIPTDMTPKIPDSEETKPNVDVIRVYDLTANGWRSFKVANVTSFGAE